MLNDQQKKKGAVITPDLFGIMSKSLNPHVLDQDTLKEMFEIRLVLEIGMADFLFQRVQNGCIGWVAGAFKRKNLSTLSRLDCYRLFRHRSLPNL